MIIDRWLVISKSGRCKITVGQPALDWDEISIRLNLSIPNELFKKPTLEAEIKIDEKSIQAPLIEPVVIDNIEKMIHEHTGIEVKLSILNKEQE